MRRLVTLACLLLAAFPASAAAQGSSALQRSLNATMRPAGGSSGAQVVDTANGRVLYQLRSTTPRVLASNTKLFTTAAALGRFGATATLDTRVLASGVSSGTVNGSLYLRGGGDPTFGSAAFTRRAYGTGATVEALAAAVRAAGVTRVSGGVVGDESLFDSRRGGPSSGYRASIYVGPLSALAFNRGLASPSGRSFQSSPPAFAAAQLTAALKRAGVAVSGRARAGRAPSGATEVAKVSSPTLARLIALTNKPSDNFAAEELLKGLAARAGGVGTTASGARSAAAFARGLGAAARLADGSGLSRGNAASPRSVTRLLVRTRAGAQGQVFFDSLAVAGRDGTLAHRMQSGPARGNCRGKTGTLSGVSALSGYCRTRSGKTLAFSILMNGVSPVGARRLQDRMAQAIAGYSG